MSVLHRWFGSGSHSVAAHVHVPRKVHGDVGVLILPPFGWEDVCSYRSLRFLAERLAAIGIPCMRFDFPGAGDSSGEAQDAGLLEAWIESVADAASDLRSATGVTKVSAIGLRLGAMLALAAANRQSLFEDLVLWAPLATGRSLLRELRVLRQMEQADSSVEQAPAGQHVPGLEVTGFLIAPDTEQALQELDLTVLASGKVGRILILTRDNLPADEKLVRALRTSGYFVTVTSGNGYAAMLAEPHDAVPPASTFDQIIDFLAPAAQRTLAVAAAVAVETPELPAEPAGPLTVGVIDNAGTETQETMLAIDRSRFSIFGILAEPSTPAPRSDLGLVFLNAGAVRHIGPNRMWVEAARRWALRGVPSLRIDFAGLGEADGEPMVGTGALYQGQFLEQIETAMHSLRSRAGTERFALIGLCAGAFWAFQAAHVSSVVAAILLNPRLFFWDPEVDRRRILRRTVDGFTTSSTWQRLVSGKITSSRIKQGLQAVLHSMQRRDDDPLQIPRAKMTSSLNAIQKNNTRLTLIFTEGEPLLQEMEGESWLPVEKESCYRCIRVPSGGHTFRPLWAQQMVHRLIDDEIAFLLNEQSAVQNGHLASLAS